MQSGEPQHSRELAMRSLIQFRHYHRLPLQARGAERPSVRPWIPNSL